ncbi:hypothetical protein AWE51_22765 [Aquimarina aggregata]|uniref:DUF192 domain-containing protein n=1 Tax=Aquimarina aggregata TaxID=1642818 RepID=A0A163BE18_9FLAO|nr:DUF192 domain-containing protein [Aquimarina aggregata]KZS41300.1 hypothetical protein AWE51_22765 [Aquimarina aggregata]
MKTTHIYSLSLLCITLAMFSCKTDQKSNTTITKEISFTKEGELSLFTLEDSIPKLITQLDIEIADSDYERETGLMYRKTMENKQGMLFISEENKVQSFYMKNTLIPLDIIYIDQGHKVVSIQKEAKPLDEKSLVSKGPAKYILEVNAKLTDLWNLKTGDSISFSKL